MGCRSGRRNLGSIGSNRYLLIYLQTSFFSPHRVSCVIRFCVIFHFFDVHDHFIYWSYVYVIHEGYSFRFIKCFEFVSSS